MAWLTARQEGTSLPAVGAWAGTGGTLLCRDSCGNKPFLCLCHACSVDVVPCSRRCRDPVGSLPGRCGGQWPVRAGQARGHPEASAAPNRAVRERVNAPGSSAPTLGGIMRLSHPSGPQHLPIACTFPLVSLSPFSVRNSSDSVSAGLGFSTWGGVGVGVVWFD